MRDSTPYNVVVGAFGAFDARGKEEAEHFENKVKWVTVELEMQNGDIRSIKMPPDMAEIYYTRVYPV